MISVRGPRYRLIGWLAVVAMLAVALLAPAEAMAGRSSPGGNNGTVKVEGTALDKYHDNDPHVGCVFFIQWYGFDEGTRSTTVTFDAHPPTGTTQLLTDTFTFVGHGSGNTLDQQKSYDLTSALGAFTPQAHQGYHVKLTVNTTKSNGSTTKHKVFWVSGCAAAPSASVKPSEAPDSSEQPCSDTDEVGDNDADNQPCPSTQPSASVEPSASQQPGGSVLPASSSGPSHRPPTSAAPTGEVEGITGTPRVTLPPTDTTAGTASTATGTWRLVLVLLAGILAGLLVLTPSLRTRRR